MNPAAAPFAARRLPRVLAALATAWLCARAAHAGLFDDDEARRAILDLRQKVDSGQRQWQDDNAQLRRSLLDQQAQIEALRAELATLRGQQEQLDRNTNELLKRQKDLTQGVDERLRKFEPIKTSVDGREFMADPAEKQEFEASLTSLRGGDFAAAQAGFQSLLRHFPDTGYRPSAQFWLGNAQYAARNYNEAIANFRKLLTHTPDHVRAPEAMLALANCQVELKDPRAARRTLDELLKQYPKSEAAAAARDRLSSLR